MENLINEILDPVEQAAREHAGDFDSYDDAYTFFYNAMVDTFSDERLL